MKQRPLFLAIHMRRVRRAMYLVFALVLSLAVIWTEKDTLSVFAPEPPAAVYSVPTDRKVVALTFDISWGDKRAEPILNVLKNKNVANATFFLSSPWSKTHPELVKKIMDAGYEIGSHGHKHDNYSTYEDAEIRKQILTAHQMLTEITGKPPRLLRLPNGDFDKRVLRIARELGYTVIQWDTDSLDWKNPGVDAIVQRVVSRAHPGDIILFHASDSAKQTHEALPIIIDRLREQGYEFVSVGQLLGHTETKSKIVEDPAWLNLI